MSSADLEAVRGDLEAITADETIGPSMPVATFLQEAFNVSRVVEDEDVRRGLLEVGLEASRLDLLPRALGALNEAEARWRVTPRRTITSEHLDNEAAAAALRKRVLDNARFALRGDRLALGTLSAIQEGRGIDDLTSDLGALAKVLELYADAFAKNRRFDRPAAIAELLRLGAALREGERLKADSRRARAKLLRDRAFTLLYGLIAELREAAAIAFPDDPARLKRFQSAWVMRRSRGKRRAADGAPEGDAP
jgi:hypothetical protein